MHLLTGRRAARGTVLVAAAAATAAIGVMPAHAANTPLAIRETATVGNSSAIFLGNRTNGSQHEFIGEFDNLEGYPIYNHGYLHNYRTGKNINVCPAATTQSAPIYNQGPQCNFGNNFVKGDRLSLILSWQIEGQAQPNVETAIYLVP